MNLWSAAMLMLAFSATGVERVDRTVYLMGTEAHLSVEALSRPAAVAASDSAIRALTAADERLSTWRSDSELARLNRLPPGEQLTLSPRLAAELRAAEACWRATGGAFDPTVGALVRVWGLRHGGRQPSSEELAQARRQTGMEGLWWHAERVVERRAEILLEEGGFGKGAGLADAVSVLEAAPGVIRAAVDLGGQVATSGAAALWTLTLADPDDRRRAVVELSIDSGSVATSGNSERGIRVGGRRRGHLLDPRSGRPAADFGSLTVWARDPLWADCLATGLYAAGPEAARVWAASNPADVEVLLLERDGGRIRAWATAGFRGRLRPLVAAVTTEFSTDQRARGRLRAEDERGWRNP